MSGRFRIDLGGPKCLAHRQGRVAEHFRRNSLSSPSRAPRARICSSLTPFLGLFDDPWALFGEPWSLVGGDLKGPRGLSGPLGVPLWAVLGALLGALGRPWGPDGSLGAPGAVLGSIWGRKLVDFGLILDGFFVAVCARRDRCGADALPLQVCGTPTPLHRYGCGGDGLPFRACGTPRFCGR